MDQFTQIVGSYSQQQLQAYIKFTEAREMLNDYEQQLADAKQQYEDAKQKAMENSDVAKMLDINTLAQLIYAQNFSMPAGYVKDSSNKSWLLKVGEEYDSIEDISGACCSMWTALAMSACLTWPMCRSSTTRRTALPA